MFCVIATTFILLLIAHAPRQGFASPVTPGAIALDSITFDKIVDGSRFVLVRFSKSYSYGAEDEEFVAFCRSAAESDLIVGDVSLKGYGGDVKVNGNSNNVHLLQRRYKIDVDNLPLYKLFLPSSVAPQAPPIDYSVHIFDSSIGINSSTDTGTDTTHADSSSSHTKKRDHVIVTESNLLRFVRHHGVHIGLPGTVESLDMLAASVGRGAQTPAEAHAITQAQMTSWLGARVESAAVYLKFFRIMMQRNDVQGFTLIEQARLNRLLLQAGNNLSATQRTQVQRRLNVLASFQIGKQQQQQQQQQQQTPESRVV